MKADTLHADDKVFKYTAGKLIGFLLTSVTCYLGDSKLLLSVFVMLRTTNAHSEAVTHSDHIRRFFKKSSGFEPEKKRVD